MASMSIDYVLTFTLAAILAIKYVAFDRDSTEVAPAPDTTVTADGDNQLSPVIPDSPASTESAPVAGASETQVTLVVPKVIIEPAEEASDAESDKENGKPVPYV